MRVSSSHAKALQMHRVMQNSYVCEFCLCRISAQTIHRKYTRHTRVTILPLAPRYDVVSTNVVLIWHLDEYLQDTLSFGKLYAALYKMFQRKVVV